VNGDLQARLEQLQALVVALHRRARTWFRRRIALVAVASAAGVGVAHVVPEGTHRLLDAASFLLAVGPIAGSLALMRSEGAATSAAAQAQAAFDAAVAGREPDATLVEPATVRRFLGVAAPEPGRGGTDRALRVAPTARDRSVAQANGRWYPDRQGVPASRAALERVWLNCTWDVPQRRFMARLAGAITVVGLSIAVAATLVIGGGWTELLLRWVAPSSVAIELTLESMFRHASLARRRADLAARVAAVLRGVDVPSGEQVASAESQLFALRETAVRVPVWVQTLFGERADPARSGHAPPG